MKPWRKYAWFSYGAFVVALSTFAVIATAVTEHRIPFMQLVGCIFTAFYVVGIFGYVTKKPILERIFWTYMFAFLSLGFVSTAALLFLLPFSSWAEIFARLVGIATNMPALYALYRYRQPSEETWINRETSISTLLQLGDGPVEAEHEIELEGRAIRRKVRISESNGSYFVHITDSNGEAEPSRYENEFNELVDVSRFIKSSAGFDLGEFRSYREFALAKNVDDGDAKN